MTLQQGLVWSGAGVGARLRIRVSGLGFRVYLNPKNNCKIVTRVGVSGHYCTIFLAVQAHNLWALGVWALGFGVQCLLVPPLKGEEERASAPSLACGVCKSVCLMDMFFGNMRVPVNAAEYSFCIPSNQKAFFLNRIHFVFGNTFFCLIVVLRY